MSPEVKTSFFIYFVQMTSSEVTTFFIYYVQMRSKTGLRQFLLKFLPMYEILCLDEKQDRVETMSPEVSTYV